MHTRYKKRASADAQNGHRQRLLVRFPGIQTSAETDTYFRTKDETAQGIQSLRSVNLRRSEACKLNSNSNALSILSLDGVALDYDGAIKTYTGSGTDLVIDMEGAALYASSPNALEVMLGEALAKTWANRYNKNTVIVLWAVERNMNDQYDLEIGKLLDKGYLEYNCRMI